jgi:predicted  nucleic acid-binding Zn-ribbon protein
MARPLLSRAGMSGEKKLTAELDDLRGELREREADAKALADRIAALQQRIDAAMSRLGRPQQARRSKVASKSASTKK